MSVTVYYTPRSKETLISVFKFICQNFGEKSGDKFVEKAGKIIKLVSEQPFMYKASAIDERVRIALITKQSSLFYHVHGESIRLLFFWDNRQEPFLSE
jgi:plasmid stabilization system protein ParE